ncbi:hypothetical protein CYN58_26745, partial [Salmonella enterica]|nr:hypothetical protein [Salmonella enterica]
MPYATDIFISEFFNSPLNTIAATLTAISLLYKVFNKIAGVFLGYKKHHSVILEKAGVSAFLLKAFFISFSLKKVPSTGLLDRFFSLAFFILFISSSWYFVPELIKTLGAPPDTALLVWKKTGETFYASESKITEATIPYYPQRSLSAIDCVHKVSNKTEKGRAERKDYLCGFMTSKEGAAYLRDAVTEFKKDRYY